MESSLCALNSTLSTAHNELSGYFLLLIKYSLACNVLDHVLNEFKTCTETVCISLSLSRPVCLDTSEEEPFVKWTL